MADRPPGEQTNGCDKCGHFTAAVTEIGEQREQNNTTARAVLDSGMRIEDISIPTRKNSGLSSLESELALQRMLCTANGDPAQCKVAAFCISRMVKESQDSALRGRSWWNNA